MYISYTAIYTDYNILFSKYVHIHIYNISITMTPPQMFRPFCAWNPESNGLADLGRRVAQTY